MGTFVLDLLILCEKVKGYYSIQIRFFLKNKKNYKIILKCLQQNLNPNPSKNDENVM